MLHAASGNTAVAEAYVGCRIKMCRKVAHKASAAAGTVAATVGDTSVRVADGIVSRMGNSNYGRWVICVFAQHRQMLRC